MRHGMVVVGLILMLTAGAAYAGPFEDGLAAEVRGDYGKAVRSYRLSADQGHARAQFNLGFMYDMGRGVPQDYTQAVKWYRLSADQGHAGAQGILGAMYDSGRGVPQDYAQALKWYRLAADQGGAIAQKNLGAMYAQGKGVPQDYVLAHMWCNLAAAGASDVKDRKLATFVRELATETRDALARKMTPAQIAEAQRLAREWKPK